MADPPDNPYVGPRTFREEEQQLFFGREREAKDLLSLVLAERLVLFYAQSGAGKSSLVNTRLRPQLRQEGFYVLPVCRVRGNLPPGVIEVDNIFVFNLILSLDQNQRPASDFTHIALSDYLRQIQLQTPETPCLLIVDQFEEVLTTNPQHWEKRDDFFKQLGEALNNNSLLWVLLSLREDYVAPLEPYVRFLPGKLRTRFYMRRLGYKAALEAIEQPAQAGGRPFAPGVAQTLVNNLRQIRVQDQSGNHLGEFVEPVQLQVVCYQLWENLKERPAAEITEQDLQELGNVDQALAQFYEQTLAKVLAKTGTSELSLRDWFERKLITEAGTRGTVYQGREKTGGLENQIVTLLADQFLLRAEPRAGGMWYELVHDRFIEPVLQANKEWRLRQNPLIQAAQAWESSGRSKDKLYQGQLLKEALNIPSRQVLEPLVQLFLDESEEAQSRQDLAEERQRAQEQARNARRLRRLVGALIVIFLLALGAAIFAWFQQQEADRNALLAIQNAREAEALRIEAEAAQAEANVARLAAQQQNFSRLLTTQALNNKDNYSLALLLGVVANQITHTVEAKSGLLEILEYSPKPIMFLNSHTDRVWSVAFSSDGKTLVTSGEDGRILLWDVNKRQLLAELPTTQKTAIYSVAFSPDGRILAAGDGVGTITLWDVSKRKPLGPPLMGHHEAVFSVAFDRSGKVLASGSQDQTIMLWNVDTGQPQHPALIGHVDYVWKVAFSPNGKILASAGRDNRVILWDVATGQALGQPLIGHKNTVASLAFSPDGRSLASGDGHGLIMLWDVATHLPLGKPLDGHDLTVWSLAFHPEGHKLISSSEDGKIILWNLATRQPLDQQFIGHRNFAFSVAFNPDGRMLVSGGGDNTVILWDMANRQRLARTLTNQPSAVFSVAFSPTSPQGTNDQILAIGRQDGLIALWNATTGQSVGTPMRGHTSDVNMVAFSPDGQIVASASDDKTIRLWDATTHQLLHILKKHTDSVTSISFSSDGKLLTSASADKTIILWDMATYQALDPPLTGHANQIDTVIFSPDDRMLVSSDRDGMIRLWDVMTRSALSQPITEDTWVYSLAFSPNGKYFASGSIGKTIILWNALTREPDGWPLADHTGPIYSLAFSPNGQTLASASRDKTIILWDTSSRQRLGQPLTAHSELIWGIAFNFTGDLLASGSHDKTVRLWDVSFDSWQTQACRVANRNFTLEEWQRYFGDQPYRKVCPKLPFHPSVMEAGRELAETGDITGAIAQVKQNLDFNPGQEAEIEASVRQIATQSLMNQGRELANTKDLAGATSQFQEALRLNPALSFNPEQEAQQLVIGALIKLGRADAKNGEISKATDLFQQALALDSTLNFEPEAEAHRLAAQALLENSRDLAKTGKTEEALKKIEEALTIDPSLELEKKSFTAQVLLEKGRVLAKDKWTRQAIATYMTAQAENPSLEILETLCRAGNNSQRDAFQVRKICDQLVDLASNAAWARNSRGVIRALNEDYEGAIEDFSFVVKVLRENPLYQGDSGREQWVIDLKAGKNPFGSATREFQQR